MKMAAFLLLLAFSLTAFGGEVRLPKSIYSPLFRDPGEVDSAIGPLLVDKTPVTNQEFLVFIKSSPQYSKSKIQPLFSDIGYLSHWTSDTTFPKSVAHFPITHVSWFVARKYCEAQGKRLPTIAEWEVASDAQNPLNEAKILTWYGKPDAPLRNVGTGAANKFGLMDTHGLIWEWVDNFSESIMSGDSRGGSSTESLFCGGAALKAKDPRLYATFMRFAFRSSLTAKYTSANLGFRCVKDITGVVK
jgi:formylglycine-generating enzyme